MDKTDRINECIDLGVELAKVNACLDILPVNREYSQIRSVLIERLNVLTHRVMWMRDDVLSIR